MKKKLIISAPVFVLAIVAAILVFVWPLSFSNVIPDEEELEIVIFYINEEDINEFGLVKHSTRQFIFSPDSAEFIQIHQILDRYSFRRSLRTFSRSTSLSTGNRYTLDFHIGEYPRVSRAVLATGDTNEIRVNNRLYRIGFFGNDTAFAMMDEIKSVLDASEPHWEMNRYAPSFRGRSVVR